MYSREHRSARQVEPVNQALGTVIFSGVYHRELARYLVRMSPQDKLTHRIDSGSRRSPWDVNSLTRIDSGSKRSPTGCKLTHRNRFWLEERPLRSIATKMSRQSYRHKTRTTLPDTRKKHVPFFCFRAHQVRRVPVSINNSKSYGAGRRTAVGAKSSLQHPRFARHAVIDSHEPRLRARYGHSFKASNEVVTLAGVLEAFTPTALPVRGRVDQMLVINLMESRHLGR
ncbi:hypothetical protein EVAR_93087_1 [Eumeta japonica]|uniref:Uncharacterized protein n=1 Tax=Eumeta variegata TaxID=151549 RepID=A0A4C1TF19_EUMVA|nr:hypothetical protein EVAR_93087_1 [Eumeta japonica]